MERDDDEDPIGFRFKPKDEELVEYYLVPRLQRQPTVPNDFTTESDVYSCHPDKLTKLHKGVDQEAWYFLSPRSRMYGNGGRPARKTRDGRGRWKASTASKEVDQKVVCNGITFCRSVLNYFEGVPKNEVRTKWIMLELTVPSFEIKPDKAGQTNMLDEFVVCKIYVSPQHRKRGDADANADEAGTSSACEGDGEEEAEEAAACSSPTQTQPGQGTEDSRLSSEKQAGKRPMREKVRPASLGGIASTQANCYSTSSYASTSSQQEPQMMQRQEAGAFNGQRLMQQQQPTKQTSLTVPSSFRPQVSLQCYYDQNYRAGGRPPATSASSPQPQMPAPSFFLPPQQPFLNNRRGEDAAAPGAATPCGSYDDPYQSRSSLEVNDEQHFVDLVMSASNPSLTGASTQTAPAPAPDRLVESQAPATAGAVDFTS